jgi:hypothetical protein
MKVVFVLGSNGSEGLGLRRLAYAEDFARAIKVEHVGFSVTTSQARTDHAVLQQFDELTLLPLARGERARATDIASLAMALAIPAAPLALRVRTKYPELDDYITVGNKFNRDQNCRTRRL